MIPIRLTLQGLYSYQEKQVIDFDRLTRSHIFGIFGPVGSGKSAILEAISYALYGRTDRLNLTGDNRYYNMMNLKSNELLIEFIFTAGKQDTEYLTLVKSRRNSRQFEDVKAIEHTAYKKINNEWTPIELSSLESIIGLSYENFKRTIIIPQGKFQEFLQLGNKERTVMMKELFNLDKYELFFKVVSLETKNNQLIQHLEGQMAQLGEISLPRIEECESNLAVLKKEIEKKKFEWAIQQGQEMEFRKLRDLFIKIKETENTINQLKNQEAVFDQLEKSLQEFEYCQVNFKGLFESAEDSVQKIVRFRKSIDEYKAALLHTEGEISVCMVDFDAAKAEYENRETYNRQAGELLKISKLHELRDTGRKLSGNILHSEKILKETGEGIAKIRGLQDELKESIRNWKLQYPDMSLLSEVREWYAIKKQLESAKTETGFEIGVLDNEIDDIYKINSQLWLDECFSEIPESNDLGKTWELLDNKKNGLTIFRDRLGNEIEHLSLQARLEEYSANLEDGKPCPLCGSLAHPLPLNTQNVGEALLLTRQQRSDCENLISGIEQNQKKVREAESTIRAKNDVLKKLQLKLAEQNVKISFHLGQFKWEVYKEESALRKAFLSAEKIMSQIKAGENQFEMLNKQLDESEKLKEKFLRNIDETRHKLTANNTESGTLLQQIELFKAEDFIDRSVEEINLARENILKKYRDTETSFQLINSRLTNLHKNRDTISVSLQANQEALAAELKSQESITARIEEQLKNSAFPSVIEIRNILSRKQDVEHDKKKVSSFRQSLAVALRQMSTLTSETGEKQYDEETHRQLTTLLNETSEEITSKNQQVGKLASDLDTMKTDLLAYTGMRDRMAALALRGEDIKTLKQLFKGSGFVNYISTVYLQELCHSANERFYKLTRQKLSLEVTDDNTFQVRDFLNGGKIRNVKTLSGGQTFQAALSLSLALADSIQKITESSQNFFFMDEGFGSLDKESLAIVFDTLKSLRKENRIVGVISHVEEMQQEIDNYLKIVMDDERGSLIQSEP